MYNSIGDPNKSEYLKRYFDLVISFKLDYFDEMVNNCESKCTSSPSIILSRQKPATSLWNKNIFAFQNGQNRFPNRNISSWRNSLLLDRSLACKVIKLSSGTLKRMFFEPKSRLGSCSLFRFVHRDFVVREFEM